eukprot:14440-Heterococcus_DN1.PRE.3
MQRIRESGHATSVQQLHTAAHAHPHNVPLPLGQLLVHAAINVLPHQAPLYSVLRPSCRPRCILRRGPCHEVQYSAHTSLALSALGGAEVQGGVQARVRQQRSPHFSNLGE